jgi:hypothetical protein
LTAWSETILLDTAKRAGVTPIISKGANANKSQITSNIESKNPTYLFFNGHGSSKVIAGQDNKSLITMGENDKLLKGKILHILACDCGKDLGKNCGAKSFIGYKGKWWLCMDQFSLSRPMKDRLAAPIIKSALEAPDQLLKGKTAKEAFDASQKTYQDWIDEFTHSESKYTTAELQLILPILHTNKSLQVVYEN